MSGNFFKLGTLFFHEFALVVIILADSVQDESGFTTMLQGAVLEHN